jgi:hypothetical protein
VAGLQPDLGCWHQLPLLLLPLPLLLLPPHAWLHILLARACAQSVGVRIIDIVNEHSITDIIDYYHQLVVLINN